MKKQAFNPYLPQNEYIPDAEPYVFDDRVYIYGSHDRFGAPMFCMNDYVCYSAPVDDLSDWRYEGVIYRKNQDPKNKLGIRLLFAPDVAKAADGKYYLYYAFDFMGIMGVAVSEKPQGPYEFYGHIHYKDGTVWGRKRGDSFPFDPGIFVDDDGKVYLYSGFYTPVPGIVTGGKRKFEGGYVLELEQDMLTIKTPEKLLFPKEGAGAFVGHEFFEASSMRKYNGKYYFVYSSKNNHELCYAISDKPTQDFKFGGTLVSQGDLFLNEDTDEKHAKNYLGNTHGSLLHLKDKYYIFYHRQTNRSSYARQACAEEIEMRQDGSFVQAEITSCGMNGKPLAGLGRYEARIACNLWSKNGTGRYDCKNPRKLLAEHPYFTQDKKDGDATAVQYIANMRDGAVAGFKYFDIQELKSASIEIRGKENGRMLISSDETFENVLTEIEISESENVWHEVSGEIRETKKQEKHSSALFFKYVGNGAIDFKAFELRKG